MNHPTPTTVSTPTVAQQATIIYCSSCSASYEESITTKSNTINSNNNDCAITSACVIGDSTIPSSANQSTSTTKKEKAGDDSSKKDAKKKKKKDKDDDDTGAGGGGFFQRVITDKDLRKSVKEATDIVRVLVKALSSTQEFCAFVRWLWQHSKNMPIVVFYRYLWSRDKPQFALTLFVNYIFPMVLEALPWYFSRRRIGKNLREKRNKIQHNMINNKEFEGHLVIKYIGLSALHAFLDTLDRHLKNKVAVLNKFIVKRLVLEKLLFSEVWALDEDKVGTMEVKITSDISSTLNLFSTVIPSIFSTTFAFVKDTRELYRKRRHIDILAVMRPTLVLAVSKVTGWVKFHLVDKKQKKITKKNKNSISRLFSNVVDGLTDLQLNNLQQYQLREFDEITTKELSVQEGIGMFLNRIYTNFAGRGIFDFISEVYVTHAVMKRRGINHEKYRKIQIEIDHTIRLAKRTADHIKTAHRILKSHKRVVSLLTLPGFENEEEQLPIKQFTFTELRMSNIKFSYNGEPPLALDIEGDIVFEQGKKYAVIGQNRSGKSTLVHIICKLYKPDSGTITLNGQYSYDMIPRTSLRSIISYVAQKPFIFPGTILENIRVGNPSATEDEVIEAATMAGIFTFEEIMDQQHHQQQGRNKNAHGDEDRDSDEEQEHESSEEQEDEEMEEIEVEVEEWEDIEEEEAEGQEQQPDVDVTGSSSSSSSICVAEESAQAPLPLQPLPVEVSEIGPAGTKNDDDEYDERQQQQPIRRRLLDDSAINLPDDFDDDALERAAAASSTSSSDLISSTPSMMLASSPSSLFADTLATTTTTTASASASQQELPAGATATTGRRLVKKKKTIKRKKQQQQQQQQSQTQTALSLERKREILYMEVEARGTNLSGGFAQSVALARVFLRPQSRIVILDESMSAMDPIKKRDVIMPRLLEFIDRHGMALILISHDMSSIQYVDWIYMLEMGSLVHQGTHEQLVMQRAEKYLQMLGIEGGDLDNLNLDLDPVAAVQRAEALQQQQQLTSTPSRPASTLTKSASLNSSLQLMLMMSPLLQKSAASSSSSSSTSTSKR